MRVRKEIRSLSSDEWDRVVDAMWTMKSLNMEDGVELYGNQFKPYDYFLVKHINAVLNPSGDQGHFGPIFPIFHRAWLLEFENSLLAIDPLISGLPYWDCTIDASLFLKYNYRILPYKSIFSKQYLGNYKNIKDKYIVTDGRFAYWKISNNGPDYGIENNGYNQLRHPLSFNSEIYITRHGHTICGRNMTLPTIEDWNTCLNSTVTMSTTTVTGSGKRKKTVTSIKNSNDINIYDKCMESKLHAPPHGFVAGTWRRANQNRDAPECVQWYGYIQPPPLINTTQIPLRTFINAYAANCFNCTTTTTTTTVDRNRASGIYMGRGRQAVNTMSICKPKTNQRTCGPLFTGFHDYIDYVMNQDTTTTTTTTTTDDKSNSDIKEDENNDSSDSKIQSAKTKMEYEELQSFFQVKLTRPEDMQVIGDFGDPAYSVNDPIFPFHHANMDRHFTQWILQQNITLQDSHYFHFPTHNYGSGNNLYDIISATDPFMNIFEPFQRRPRQNIWLKRLEKEVIDISERQNDMNVNDDNNNNNNNDYSRNDDFTSEIADSATKINENITDKHLQQHQQLQKPVSEVMKSIHHEEDMSSGSGSSSSSSSNSGNTMNNIQRQQQRRQRNRYHKGPYTVKDIFDYTVATRYEDQLYTYDSIQKWYNDQQQQQQQQYNEQRYYKNNHQPMKGDKLDDLNSDIDKQKVIITTNKLSDNITLHSDINISDVRSSIYLSQPKNDSILNHATFSGFTSRPPPLSERTTFYTSVYLLLMFFILVILLYLIYYWREFADRVARMFGYPMYYIIPSTEEYAVSTNIDAQGITASVDSTSYGSTSRPPLNGHIETKIIDI